MWTRQNTSEKSHHVYLVNVRRKFGSCSYQCVYWVTKPMPAQFHSLPDTCSVTCCSVHWIWIASNNIQSLHSLGLFSLYDIPNPCQPSNNAQRHALSWMHSTHPNGHVLTSHLSSTNTLCLFNPLLNYSAPHLHVFLPSKLHPECCVSSSSSLAWPRACSFGSHLSCDLKCDCRSSTISGQLL